MVITDSDWLLSVEILAGWEPQWDPATVFVNGVPCMARSSLIQILQDSIESKASAQAIVRKLVEEHLLQPARVTSRKDTETGQQKSFQVHEVSITAAKALYAELQR